MRGFVITVALASLVIPTVMADPAPSQTPAELQQSAPAAPALVLTSQPAKAEATEAGKAQTTAQLAAKTPAKDSASLDASANADNAHADGGVLSRPSPRSRAGAATITTSSKSKTAGSWS